MAGGFSRFTRARPVAPEPSEETPALKAWSYSRWARWMECPRRAYYSYICKLPDPSGAAAERGTAIHAQAEEYLRAMGRPRFVPGELKRYSNGFKMLRRRGARAEQEIVVRENWQVLYETPQVPRPWIHESAWCRGKVDALVWGGAEGQDATDATVIDFKTGRAHPPNSRYRDQLEFYALLTFLWHPQALRVRCAIWYLDHPSPAGGTEAPEHDVTYTRADDAERLRGIWDARARKLLSDTEYAPRPGEACRWCPYSPQRGGPCVAGSSAR